MYSELQSALCAMLEQAIAKAVPLFPALQQHLYTLEGKAMQLEVSDLQVTMVCVVQAGALKTYAHYGSKADVRLRLRSVDLLKLLVNREANLLAMEVDVDGDMAVAQAYQQAFALAHLDVQDWLDKVLGRQTSNTLQQNISQGLQSGKDQLQRQVNQKLADLVAAKPEVDAFVADVDKLRAQLDRMAARMARLGS